MKSNKDFLKHFVSLVLVLAISVFLFSSSVLAQAEYKWRFAFPYSRELSINAMTLFCDLVNVYSDGKMEVKLYPNSLLGSHNENFHAVQEGSVEITAVTPYVNLVPGGMLYAMPWSIETFEQVAAAYQYPDGILRKVMSKVWEDVGFHFLSIGLEGQFGLANNLRPIKHPDDFKNIKFRVSASLAGVRAIENMAAGTGLTLATVPWTDLYGALERGVVDGNWDSWFALVGERHYEVLKYFTALDMWFAENHVVVNKEKWDKLPPEIQEAFNKAARVTEIYETELLRRNAEDFIKIISEGGCEIYFPTSEEREVFREKANMPAVWEELCKPYLDEHYPGQNMTQKILDELEKIRQKYPYMSVR